MNPGVASPASQTALIAGILSYWQAVSPQSVHAAPFRQRKNRRRPATATRNRRPGAMHMGSQQTNA